MIKCLAVVMALSLSVGMNSKDAAALGKGPPFLRCTPRGAWKTSDLFVVPGTESTSAAAIGASTNAIFVAGSAGEAFHPGKSWIVRRSLDRGGTWQTVDVLDTVTASPAGVAVDPVTNAVYVVGNVEVNDSNPVWVVRRSRDEGNTWETAGTFRDTVSVSRARAIAVDGAGKVYVTGGNPSFSAGVPFRWVTLRSDDGATTFKKVDTEDEAGPTSLMAFQDGTVVGAGFGHRADVGSYSAIRSSKDGGATWVPYYAQDSLGPLNLTGIASFDESTDTAVVVGTRFNSGGNTQMLAFTQQFKVMSSPSDYFAIYPASTSAPVSANARGVTLSDRGRIYLTGQEESSNSLLTRSGNLGFKFTTSDQVKGSLTPPLEQSFSGVAKDSDGDMVSAGRVSDGISTSWTVRVQRCKRFYEP